MLLICQLLLFVWGALETLGQLDMVLQHRPAISGDVLQLLILDELEQLLSLEVWLPLVMLLLLVGLLWIDDVLGDQGVLIS